MSHIFISYSKKNSTYAYALADFLQEQGFNIWIDRIGVEYGVGWWDAIVDGLDKCGAVIVVMTPEAKASDWVQREVFIALQDKKPIFPLLLNGDNWKVFVLTQYVDVTDGSLPDGDLLKRLSHHVTPRGKGANLSDLTPEKHGSHPTPPTPHFDVDQAIADFGKVFRAHNWSEALNILGRIRASGEDPTPFDPDEFERRVQNAIEEEKRQRERQAYEAERDRQYGRVVAMSSYADDAAIWTALQKVWQNFPDYDPDHLAERVRPRPKRPVMPAPFAWIDIPAGKVKLIPDSTDKKESYLKKDTIFDVPAFAIAKYPITNAQYAKFMEAGGYRERHWWTDAGWDAREQGYDWDSESSSWKPTGKAWTEPRYWADQKWNGAEQPVVGISWYESLAFCLWLSEVSGEQILLPTEQQWQRAAQGDDERTYPWGNEWDCKRCNNSVSPCDSNQTTPVTTYEGKQKGDSPFGVVDMAGNVWEWCLTAYDKGNIGIDGTNRRVLRGGSWTDHFADYFRVAYRNWNAPNGWNALWGFRVSRS